jgi:hypothetical protein
MDPISTQLMMAAKAKIPYDGALALAISGTVSPYLAVYKVTAANGIGIKYSNPSTLPISSNDTGSRKTIVFGKRKKFLALSTNSYPYLYAVQFDKDTGFGSEIPFQSTADIPDAAPKAIATKVSEYGTQNEDYNYITMAIAGSFNGTEYPELWTCHMQPKTTAGTVGVLDYGRSGFIGGPTDPVFIDIEYSPSGLYLLALATNQYPRLYQWQSFYNDTSPNAFKPYTGLYTIGTTWLCGDWHPNENYVVLGGSNGLRGVSMSGGWGGAIGTSNLDTGYRYNSVRFTASGASVIGVESNFGNVRAYRWTPTGGTGGLSAMGGGAISILSESNVLGSGFY